MSSWGGHFDLPIPAKEVVSGKLLGTGGYFRERVSILVGDILKLQ